MMDELKPRRWYHWYSPSDTPAERNLLVKLDFLLVGYAFVMLWVKYIDQTNINNAYVSGMSNELNFHGNQLVHFQTVFLVANVVGLVPFLYLFPKVPMYWLIPALEFGWGIFTLLQFRAQSYSEIIAYRFIVGIFEAPFYSGVQFVIGSWYTPDELARRGGIFHTALSLGTMTASLLQAAAAKHLSGVNGLAGWRWNFIITSIFPLVMAPIGYFIWPGTPYKPNLRVISKSDLAVARVRLDNAGSQIRPSPFSLSKLRSILAHPKVYALVAFLAITFQCSAGNGSFLLWVKSLSRYSIPTVNNIGAVQPAVSIFFIVTLNFGADMVFGRTIAFLLAAALNFTAMTILAVWHVPEDAKWFAFAISGMTASMTPLIYSWANDILRGDIEERALTLVLMQIVATSLNASIPLLVWQTKEAPRYPKGFPYACAMTFVAIAMALLIRIVYRKEEEKLKMDQHTSDGDNNLGDSKSLVLQTEKILRRNDVQV